MLGKRYDSQICSIARALEVVGERWSLLIIRDAVFAGVTRFNDFQHNLGIASNVLASRLDGFVEAGIMERRQPDDSAPAEYVLTAMGRDLITSLVALTEWGDRWVAPDEPPILYQHDDCGGSITAQAVCDRCGEVRDPAEVGVRLGPGMPMEYVANRRPHRER